ncbi:CopG family transcriptional regulator [Calidifontibacillus erzurumensis]|uniref:CopG family transcriptional regulator n=1 Tax=Calidifontibacillus erzurumensis TaxID=2741433 RepID=UPI0035B520E0
MTNSRSKQHGGKREGAGRKSLGITKKVSITLEKEVWEEIEEKKGKEPMSSFLRKIILKYLKKDV